MWRLTEEGDRFVVVDLVDLVGVVIGGDGDSGRVEVEGGGCHLHEGDAPLEESALCWKMAYERVRKWEVLFEITESGVDVLDNAIDIPGEDLSLVWLSRGSCITIRSDIAEAFELVAGEGFIQKIERFGFLAPFESLDQLVFGFVEVTIVGIEVLLEDNLRRDVGIWISKFDSPDLTVAVRLG